MAAPMHRLINICDVSNTRVLIYERTFVRIYKIILYNVLYMIRMMKDQETIAKVFFNGSKYEFDL